MITLVNRQFSEDAERRWTTAQRWCCAPVAVSSVVSIQWFDVTHKLSVTVDCFARMTCGENDVHCNYVIFIMNLKKSKTVMYQYIWVLQQFHPIREVFAAPAQMRGEWGLWSKGCPPVTTAIWTWLQPKKGKSDKDPYLFIFAHFSIA